MLCSQFVHYIWKACVRPFPLSISLPCVLHLWPGTGKEKNESAGNFWACVNLTSRQHGVFPLWQSYSIFSKFIPTISGHWNLWICCFKAQTCQNVCLNLQEIFRTWSILLIVGNSSYFVFEFTSNLLHSSGSRFSI